jgi:uncharacterized membrane protein
MDHQMGRLFVSEHPASNDENGLAGSQKSYHSVLSTNAGSAIMRGARWGLSVLFVSLATLLIGVGEARSQAAQLQLCNQSNESTSVAVARQASINDARLILSGWYIVAPNSCSATNVYLPWGNVYFFAVGEQGDTWSGTDERFCVSTQAFVRFIDPSPGCPPGLIVEGFSRFYVSGVPMYTWTMLGN